jgi:hypothetical protein
MLTRCVPKFATPGFHHNRRAKVLPPLQLRLTMCLRKLSGRSLQQVIGIALLPILLATPTASLPADDAAAGVRVFAEAMARMMDAMGLLGDGADMPGGVPLGMGQMPWQAMPGAAVPGAAMSDMGAWMRQLPGANQLPGVAGWQQTSLDGIWEGRDGGLLIVQAHRFRLYSAQGDYIDGLIQQRGDRIAIYDAERDVARPYEFAQHQGRLVLRDAGGQVYLYRRLWLDERVAGESVELPR